MRLSGNALAALALALMVGGCAAAKPGYQLLNETSEIDPATGDTILTSYWTLAGGTTAVTSKRIKRGNEQRRTDHPLPPAAAPVVD